MRAILPITVTEAKLTATNVAENDYAVWAIGTTYARGDFCISTTTHTVYRSLTDSNLGNDPDAEIAALADPLIDDPNPVNWQIISATNRWKMFDGKPSNLCTNAESITLTIEPGQFVGGVGFFEITAETVQLDIVDPVEGIVYTKTVDMQDESVVTDWYSYYFEDIVTLNELVMLDLPPYSNAEYQITITNTGGTAKVGQIAIGPIWEIGTTLIPNLSVSGLDFSFVQNDEFGDLVTVKREATQLNTFDILIPSTDLFGFARRMKDLRGGSLAVWIGNDDSRLRTINFGFSRDWRNVYSTRDISVVSLQIQGVV